MADQVTNYKCPLCSGPLHFAPASGKMECEYCDSSFTVEEIEAKYAQANAEAVQAKKEADNKPAAAEDEWEVSTEEWNNDGMKAYNCPSCGATLLCEDTTGASSCPYCGNPTIVPAQFEGAMKPDYVVPFKIDKNAAVEALKKFYGSKYLVPKSFKSGSHLDEVQGVYVPFWLYDGYAQGECVYEAVKKEVKKTADEEIITSRIYSVERSGNMRFEKIPADASTKMDDDMMDSIEPYDYKELKPFTNAYMTGYLADQYDVSAKDNAKRAIARAKESTKNALFNDVKGYDTVTPRRENIRVQQGKAYYAMMPVWMLTTSYNGKDYKFAMNGQSGKPAGELPMDKGKFWLTLLIVALAFVGFAFLKPNAMKGIVILGVITTAIVGCVLKGSLKNVAKKTVAGNYIAGDKLNVTHRSDNFIRQTVEKKPINKPQAATAGASAGANAGNKH